MRELWHGRAEGPLWPSDRPATKLRVENWREMDFSSGCNFQLGIVSRSLVTFSLGTSGVFLYRQKAMIPSQVPCNDHMVIGDDWTVDKVLHY